MKYVKIVLFLIALAAKSCFAQQVTAQKYPHRLFTVEPGVGIHANFGTDLLLSTMVQWNPLRKLAVASHSSYNINNIAQREFNYITTDYNYSLNQKFGAGITLYARRSSHSFLLMAGVKYTAYQETLHNPDLPPASQSISSTSPDYGIMYSLKKGGRNAFFVFRAYLPLYPYPLKGFDLNYADGNMNNIAVEFGVGFKIK